MPRNKQAHRCGSPEGAGAHSAGFSQAGDSVLRHHHAAEGQDRLCPTDRRAGGALYRACKIDLVLGIEARGFIFGPALAYRLNAGFVPVRKPRKLPAPVARVTYDLEYGSDTLEIHLDAIQPGQRVVLVDDLLATGGTMEATVKLVKQLGGEIAGLAFAVELDFLKGRDRFPEYDVFSLLHYDE
jgi:adenine phosphoribosyltransferase